MSYVNITFLEFLGFTTMVFAFVSIGWILVVSERVPRSTKTQGLYNRLLRCYISKQV